ncbi:hypothetical protein V2J70_02045 [Pseudomonas alliivorans]|nr:hypothetical protein [Pseudomonas alliivorans]
MSKEYKLVPASMLLEKTTIGAILFHCGDGSVVDLEECSEGLLWIGDVTDDDGKTVHGLHISTAEYPEEGSTTLVEFAAPQPPALAGEPEVLCWVVTDMNGDFYFAANRQTPADTPLIDRAHLAPLQAENQQNKELLKAYMNSEAEKGIELVELRAKIDQLKARNVELHRMLGLAWGNEDVSAEDCRKIDATLSKPAGSEQV